MQKFNTFTSNNFDTDTKVGYYKNIYVTILTLILSPYTQTNRQSTDCYPLILTFIVL